jgi:hypothetical protein
MVSVGMVVMSQLPVIQLQRMVLTTTMMTVLKSSQK